MDDGLPAVQNLARDQRVALLALGLYDGGIAPTHGFWLTAAAWLANAVTYLGAAALGMSGAKTRVPGGRLASWKREDR